MDDDHPCSETMFFYREKSNQGTNNIKFPEKDETEDLKEGLKRLALANTIAESTKMRPKRNRGKGNDDDKSKQGNENDNDEQKRQKRQKESHNYIIKHKHWFPLYYLNHGCGPKWAFFINFYLQYLGHLKFLPNRLRITNLQKKLNFF